VKNPFRRKANPPLSLSQTANQRLVAAVEELNNALDAMPPGNRISPWVKRRPGQRPLAILQEWTPGEGRRIWPPSDSDRLLKEVGA
jgi:hypothetical protein